jgi:sn-glycerol 3-phosphate transport system ATP-binding protein
MAVVELRNVEKSYGQAPAVRGISCRIDDGELVVLVGPSGCGKSTLLRMVAGLEEVTRGEVVINDRVMNDIDPKDRDIAMVFQTYALYPHMTVAENMAYGLRMRRLPKSEIAQRLIATAEKLQLQQLLSRRPSELSGGQRQRVAMGRAIIRQPQVFLFDEPLSNLDANLRTQMRVEIKRLQSELGTTSIYVTHDQVEAMTLADRLVVMNGGVVEQIGSPIEVYERPATTFVGKFIGSPSMNFLPASISDDGEVVLASGAAVGRWDGSMPASGRRISLGIRPEHLEITGEAASLVLRVEFVEMLGADTVAYGHFGSAPVLVRVPGARRVNPNDSLPLAIPLRYAHLFDEQGQRLRNGIQALPSIVARCLPGLAAAEPALNA